MNDFSFEVDYSLSQKDMIRINQFDYMCYDSVTEQRFPFPAELRGKKIILIGRLFHFPKGAKNGVNVIFKMVEKGFRPATFAEILSFGQRDCKIAGLGTYFTDGLSRRWTPVLNIFRYGTHLGVHDFDCSWDADFLFLAIRK